MKKLLLLLVAAVALISCSKDDNKGKLDSNAMISIRPAAGTKLKSDNPAHFTAKMIVDSTYNMCFINESIFNSSEPVKRGFSDAQRDTLNLRLLMFGTDIITQTGQYCTEFIEGRDIVLETRPQFDKKGDLCGGKDTIAYIPNSVIINARSAIKSAYDAGNYTECYRLFDNAFTFTPITGAEWRALKAQGLN